MPDKSSSIEFAVNSFSDSIIKVIGVGGGGGNAVNNMFDTGIVGVDFMICNTDRQALDKSPIQNKIQLGEELTSGLGAGSNPEIGKNSALESIDEIKELLGANTKMVFVTAGMGGGTGTGAAPVISKLAKEMGILTVGIVTSPFAFEGSWRNDIAKKGVAEMESCVDTLLVINNNSLLSICPKSVSMMDAFKTADQVLCDAAKGIAEIITTPGYINVDFADVKTVMQDSGTALMGMAAYAGEDRALQAIEDALNSPLLENVDVNGASGVLLNISTSQEQSMSVDEMKQVGDYVQNAVGEGARIIMGNAFHEETGDEMTITLIATGFQKSASASDAARASVQQPAEPTPPVIEEPLETVRGLTAAKAESDGAEPPLRPRGARPERSNAAPARKFSRITPQERLQRMNETRPDYRSASSLKNIEDRPAYERRQISIEDEAQYEAYSSYSVESRKESQSYQFKDNAYLFGSVD